MSDPDFALIAFEITGIDGAPLTDNVERMLRRWYERGKQDEREAIAAAIDRHYPGVNLVWESCRSGLADMVRARGKKGGA